MVQVRVRFSGLVSVRVTVSVSVSVRVGSGFRLGLGLGIALLYELGLAFELVLGVWLGSCLG